MERNEEVPKRAGAVQSNIHAIAEMQQHLEERRGLVDRLADLIAGFSGSMGFVLVHVVWFAGWFLWNTGVIPGLKRFDPYPFILLAMIVSVEGVLLSTFVLMKQNRMQRRNDARDHVNLQIDLLAEKEVTKSLRLLQTICRKLEISESEMDPELDEMMTTTSVDTLAGDVRTKLLEHDEKWVRRQGVMAAHESDKIERAKRVVSDEAIDDVQWMTRKIVQLRAKGKA